jgi:NTE family protein
MAGNRVALVLSAGGLRGAAHVGVLRQLLRHSVRIDAIVGVSAGAVVAAYYAAVGLGIDELIRDAEIFRGSHLLAHSLNVRTGYHFDSLASRCGVIPQRLKQLDEARFDRLHHGIQLLGIVCHDITAGRSRYFATGADHGLTVGAAVRASASMPFLFPPVSVRCDGQTCSLTDGGLLDAVPLVFARGPLVGATHVIVSDCRRIGRVPRSDETVAWIRPRMSGTGTLRAPARGLRAAVDEGEAAVGETVVGLIKSWNVGEAARLARSS